MTAVTRKTRALVIARDEGICGWCGYHCRDGVGDLQHRRARGAGGSRQPDTNLPSNLVLLHRECHTYVESHREEATRRGFIVFQGKSPAVVPVLVKAGPAGRWVRLDDVGGREVIRAGDAVEYMRLIGAIKDRTVA